MVDEEGEGSCRAEYGTNVGGFGIEFPVPYSWTKFSTSLSGSSWSRTRRIVSHDWSGQSSLAS